MGEKALLPEASETPGGPRYRFSFASPEKLEHHFLGDPGTQRPPLADWEIMADHALFRMRVRKPSPR